MEKEIVLITIGIYAAVMLVFGFLAGKKTDSLAGMTVGKRNAGAWLTAMSYGCAYFSAVMFIAGFVVAGLDHRFTLSHVPVWVVCIASVVLLSSYALYAEVMRENAYLSRTVEVQKGQKVVDTGLYGIVRHPMYAATVCMFLSIPVVLGSWWALLCFLPYVVMIAFRIIDEENVLENGLEGYVEYKNKVRYRLIPFVW